MTWSDLDWSPSRRVLRQFSALCLILLLTVGCWHRSRGHEIRAEILFILALSIGPLGLARPGAVRPLFITWMMLVFPIGWVVSRLAIAAMYFGVIVPLGLLFKLIRRDVLCRRYEPEVDTYWVQRPATVPVTSYFRPY
jgi:hypothetical protein